MQKEEINLIAQLLMGIKDALDKMKFSQKENDLQGVIAAKREILNFQKQIDKLL
jgi:hypothetical protein